MSDPSVSIAKDESITCGALNANRQTYGNVAKAGAFGQPTFFPFQCPLMANSGHV